VNTPTVGWVDNSLMMRLLSHKLVPNEVPVLCRTSHDVKGNRAKCVKKPLCKNAFKHRSKCWNTVYTICRRRKT